MLDDFWRAVALSAISNQRNLGLTHILWRRKKMISVKEVNKGLEVNPSYNVYNSPTAHSNYTDLSSNGQFSQMEAPWLESSTAGVRALPLNVGGYQGTSRIEQLAIQRSELLAIRRQLLQGQTINELPVEEETSNNRSGLREVIKSKGIIRKCFLA